MRRTNNQLTGLKYKSLIGIFFSHLKKKGHVNVYIIHFSLGFSTWPAPLNVKSCSQLFFLAIKKIFGHNIYTKIEPKNMVHYI